MATIGGVTRLDSNKKLSYNKRQQLDILDAYGKKHGLSFITVDTLRSGKDQANVSHELMTVEECGTGNDSERFIAVHQSIV